MKSLCARSGQHMSSCVTPAVTPAQPRFTSTSKCRAACCCPGSGPQLLQRACLLSRVDARAQGAPGSSSWSGVMAREVWVGVCTKPGAPVSARGTTCPVLGASAPTISIGRASKNMRCCSGMDGRMTRWPAHEPPQLHQCRPLVAALTQCRRGNALCVTHTLPSASR